MIAYAPQLYPSKSLASSTSVLRDLGRPKEAEQFHRLALQTGEKLCADFPDDAGYQSVTGGRLNNLAMLLLARGERDEARRLLERAITRQKAALASNRRHPTYRQFLRNHYSVLARTLMSLQDEDGAEKAMQEALALQEELAAEYPDIPAYRQNLAESLVNLAEFRYKAKRHEESGRLMLRALEIEEKLAAEFPTSAVHRKGVALTLLNLAFVRYAQQHHAEADELFRRSLAYRDVVPDIGHKYAFFLTSCPDPRYRDAKRGVQLAAEAARNEPKSADCWQVLALAQYRAGDWQATLAACQKALEFATSGDAYHLLVMAMAHWQLGHKEEARQWYNEAV